MTSTVAAVISDTNPILAATIPWPEKGKKVELIAEKFKISASEASNIFEFGCADRGWGEMSTEARGTVHTAYQEIFLEEADAEVSQAVVMATLQKEFNL